MQFGYGTKFSRWNGAFFETVAGLITIEHSEVTRPPVQVTEIDDTEGYHSFEPNEIRDPGEMSITLEWDQDDARQSLLKSDMGFNGLRVYRVTYPGGQIFTFRGFITAWGKTITMEDRIVRTVKFKLSGSLLNGKNLLAESGDTWVSGTSGSQGNYAAQGSITPETVNSIITFAGPHGISQPVWKVIPEVGNPGQPDGGFAYTINSNDGFDPNKTYRFVTWHNQETFDGEQSLIAHESNTNNLDGTAASNPAFINAQDMPQNNKWYLLVGVLHKSTAVPGDATGITGIYDPTTGTKVHSGTEYKSASGATSQKIVDILSNHETGGNLQKFAVPRIEELDGAIPLEFFFE